MDDVELAGMPLLIQKGPARGAGAPFVPMAWRRFRLKQRPTRRIAFRVGALLACGMLGGAALGSSVPYLKQLKPAPLRFRYITPINLELLAALGPLPGSVETTNAIASTPTTKETAAKNDPGDETKAGAAIGSVSLEPYKPLIPAVLESTPTAAETISPQTLLPYLCAPGPGSHNPSRPTTPLFFNPPQPVVPPSSSASYTVIQP